MESALYHLVIYTPLSHAEEIRRVLAASGAGRIGNYDSCSFSVRGTGRFRPLKGADPAIGSVGSLEEVEEERIEVVVKQEDLNIVLQAVLDAHPYEEPALHVWGMEDYHDLLERA